MRKFLQASLVLGLVFSVFTSCRFSRVVRDLHPEHKEFLSGVRYIINKKEKKVFLDLPSPEREKFIEQFWKQRDPDPDTEINEFKEDYYERIEKANHLFREGGTPGWLQDRGRIYILLGPPGSRDKYPTGYRFYDRPSEVWYYGFFPIIFIDYSYTGNYELVLISAQYVARLLKAQIDLKPEVKIEGETLGFKLNLEKIADDQVKALIEIPYKNIWLLEKDGKLETTLLLSLDVFTDSKKKVWGFKEEYSISLDQDEITETLGKNYVIPVEINLSQGKYRMNVLLENKTDGKKVTRTLKFDL